jgi:ADP-ribosylglycohydrolase
VALWGFFRYDSWEKGALAVVNRGGDSDTAGAVYGALAGVFYGVDAIPQRWVDGMQNAKLIYETARLFSEVVIAKESR